MKVPYDNRLCLGGLGVCVEGVGESALSAVLAVLVPGHEDASSAGLGGALSSETLDLAVRVDLVVSQAGGGRGQQILGMSFCNALNTQVGKATRGATYTAILTYRGTIRKEKRAYRQIERFPRGRGVEGSNGRLSAAGVDVWTNEDTGK